MTMLYVPFPVPVLSGLVCERCDGAGVLATSRATMDLGSGRALLVDVFCPACEGCGSGGGHASCAGPHSWDDDPGRDDDFDPDDAPDDLLDEHAEERAAELDGRCLSCFGRGWNMVLGFGTGGDGQLAADIDDEGSLQMLRLRVPCGCQEHRMAPLREVAF